MLKLLLRVAGATALTLAPVGSVTAQDHTAAETIEPNRLVPPDADLPSGSSTGAEKVGVGESHAAARDGRPTQDTETGTAARSEAGQAGDGGSTGAGEPAPTRLKTQP